MQYLPVVKAGKDNGIYVTEDPMKIEDRKITPPELPAFLARIKQKYGAVVYFRESVFTDPDKAYFSQISSILDAIAAAKIAVKMGDEYLDAYGEITNFTLHIAPDIFRFGGDKGELFVYAFIPEGQKKLAIHQAELKDPAVWKNTLAKDFGMIFHGPGVKRQKQGLLHRAKFYMHLVSHILTSILH